MLKAEARGRLDAPGLGQLQVRFGIATGRPEGAKLLAVLQAGDVAIAARRKFI
jgi:hypothetical protein